MIALDAMKVERLSRILKISIVLADLKLVQELNEGVKKIYKEMKDFFLDELEFSEPNGRAVKLVLRNNIVMRNKRKTEILLKNDSLNKKWTRFNLMEQQILQAIHDRGKMSTSELVELVIEMERQFKEN